MHVYLLIKSAMGLSQWLKGALPMAQAVKNLPVMQGDMGSIPGSERSPGGGNSNLLQYSCLENLIDRRAGQATVLRVATS